MKSNLAKVVEAAESTTDVTRAILDACVESKGKEIVALDVSSLSDLAETLVFVSGRSDRQVQGIGNKILEAAERLGIQPISVEGYDTAHWLLLDLGDVVVHVFYEPLRAHYNLEEIWSNAPSITLEPISA